jgi:lysophospholipase L1-like esterase
MATALLRLSLWLIAAAGMGMLVSPAAPAFAADCAVPSDYFVFEPMLPRTVAALSAGKNITIVAIGSASTVGRAAGGPDYAWPKQLGAALSKEFPKAKISVVNLGKARQTAANMTARFAKEIIPLAPMLVIWETGTVDAVRSVEIGEFRDTLQSGLTQLKAVSEVALMGVQFSRRTHIMTDFEPYEAAIREVADVNDVPMFPRNDLMRYWSEAGEFDYTVEKKEARQEMARRLYGCIGRALAEFVTRRPHTPEPHQ